MGDTLILGRKELDRQIKNLCRITTLEHITQEQADLIDGVVELLCTVEEQVGKTIEVTELLEVCEHCGTYCYMDGGCEEHNKINECLE